jgi:hypothetical protein
MNVGCDMGSGDFPSLFDRGIIPQMRAVQAREELAWRAQVCSPIL